jgi:serine/threonine-protein kinase
VALKEIRAVYADDAHSRARFLLEAEVTGGLEHPGIVPVYGLGRYADGRPFYAMRFIKGATLKEAIDRFHREDRPGRDPGERGLALRELLGRFMAVSNAVSYAHSRGILHRDIKPANVMLGAYGETLVVDWGLAKPLGQPPSDGPAEPALRPSGGGSAPTQMGSAVGTPAYMSPEQAAGRLDLLGPASDVYSLGATLYTLLTGKGPVEASDLATVLRRVREGNIPRPRQVKPDIHPALEAVCLKAMALDSRGRYASARELADDVERWLAGEPVKAWPEPWTVRAGRWLRRHRTAVTSAVAALAVAALVLAVATVLLNSAYARERDARTDAQTQRDEAVKQQRRADANFVRARKAVENYLDKVTDHPLLRENDFHDLRQELLRTAVPLYDELVTQQADDPALQADRGAAYARLAGVRAALGETTKAVADYRQAVTVFAGTADRQQADARALHNLAAAQANLATLLFKLGQRDEGEAGYREAIRGRRKLAAEFPGAADYQESLALTHDGLGVLLRDGGRREQAEAEHREALRVLGRFREPTPEARENAAKVRHNLGIVLRERGNHEDAAAAQREAATVLKGLLDAFPATAGRREYYARCEVSLGSVLRELERTKPAEAAFREGVAAWRELAKSFPRVVGYREGLAGAADNLALLLQASKRFDEAEPLFRETIKTYRVLTENHPDVPDYREGMARGHNNMGIGLTKAGRTDEAEAAFREAIRLRKALAKEFPDAPRYREGLVTAYNHLGMALQDADRPDDAETAYRSALAAGRALNERFPGIPLHLERLASIHNNLAGLLTQAGRRKDAEAEFRRALPYWKALADAHPAVPGYRSKLAMGHFNLGLFLQKGKQTEPALAEFNQAIPLLEKLSTEGTLTAQGREVLRLASWGRADTLDQLGRPGDAARSWRRALEGAPAAQRVPFRTRLAFSLARAGDHAEAAAEAEALLKGKSSQAVTFDAARVLALASAAAKADSALAEKYAARAVELLGELHAEGFFAAAKNAARLRTDPDLEPLGRREDYRKLMAQIEGEL